MIFAWLCRFNMFSVIRRKKNIIIIIVEKVNRLDTRDIEPILFQDWANVCDAGPLFKQHRFNAPVCATLSVQRYYHPLEASINDRSSDFTQYSRMISLNYHCRH